MTKESSVSTGPDRKNVPMDEDQLGLLKRLTTEGTRERAALRELVPRVRKSEASVLSALITLGSRVVREEALAAGYAELVAKTSRIESKELRAITAARRAREGANE
jgi:hypothetical protein